MNCTEQSYELAKAQYTAFGIDTDAAIEKALSIPISLLYSFSVCRCCRSMLVIIQSTSRLTPPTISTNSPQRSNITIKKVRA